MINRSLRSPAPNPEQRREGIPLFRSVKILVRGKAAARELEGKKDDDKERKNG